MPAKRARQAQQTTTRKRKQSTPDSDDESSDSGSVHGVDDESASDDDDDDADAPRATRWEDEDEQGNDSDEASEVDDENPESSLRKDLSSVPFGALLKARAALSKQDEDESSDSASEESNNEEASDSGEESDSAKPPERRQIDKRSHKHAPVEVTSKRAVPRFRPAVEVKKVQSRDPRFNPLAGPLKEEGFQSAYSFLPDLHVEELATLKDNLTRARKLLSNSPRDLRQEREQEVQRLEMAVRRLESIVQREHRSKVEHDALQAIKKEEQEKRKHGKGQWFMKDSEKKQVMLKARYDDLAASGKRGAVQKAIDKKQRKVAQKEKKARPFAAPARSGGSRPPSRSSDSGSRPRPDAGWPNKRQKFT